MRLTRKQIIYGSLILTLVIVAWTAMDDDDNSEPTKPARSQRAAQSTTSKQNKVDASGNLMKLNRDPLVESSTDPFAVVNFVPPPPVIASMPPPPPPKPTAPPFPYRFFGMMTDVGGVKTTYLQKGDELMAIKNHQMLDTNYRVESVDEKQIVIVYLPLEEKTILTIQSAENQ